MRTSLERRCLQLYFITLLEAKKRRQGAAKTARQGAHTLERQRNICFHRPMRHLRFQLTLYLSATPLFAHETLRNRTWWYPKLRWVNHWNKVMERIILTVEFARFCLTFDMEKKSCRLKSYLLGTVDFRFCASRLVLYSLVNLWSRFFYPAS